MNTYDAIVLGLGGMGSAAAYHLARRGHRVLGLDAHPRGHREGSSHGHSRIIREAYFEAPEYVPLVRRSYALWRELEPESGRQLLSIVGGLNIGRPDGELVSGALASVRKCDIPHEYLTPDELSARFPGFRLADDMVGLYEASAGILQPEECVAAHLDRAAEHGAELRHGEPVRRWRAKGAGVQVETDGGAYGGARLVIAAGPWASEVLGALQIPLEVVRKVNVHFEPTRPQLFAPDQCPVYIWDVPEGQYFGFPNLPGQGVKVGRHDGGEVCTPRTIRRDVDRDEIEELRTAFDRYMPGVTGDVKSTLTCMYTNTPDRDFVVDRHPDHPQIVYACGFSGHGFKFASVMGETLADLAIEGHTAHPVDFLSTHRFRSAPKAPVRSEPRA
jgi:sarcosine oxidase